MCVGVCVCVCVCEIVDDTSVMVSYSRIAKIDEKDPRPVKSSSGFLPLRLLSPMAAAIRVN